MIRKIAWNTFKNTGDINTFLEFKQIETIENALNQTQNISKDGIKQDGQYKNEWNHTIGE